MHLFPTPRFFFAGLTLATILTGCGGPRQLQNKVVTHQYVNTTFAPESVVQELGSGVTVTITPVDASHLNQITYEAATRDGEYEREYVNVSQEKLSQLGQLSRTDRWLVERKLEVTALLEAAITAGRVADVELARLALNRFWDEGAGRDGSEVDYLVGSKFPPDHNPYRLNGAYLSVFKVELDNGSDDVAGFDIDALQVSHGVELLYPLKNEFFDEALPKPSSLLTNILRMNLPDRLSLPEGATVVKYVSIPAIAPGEERLSIQYMGEDGARTFDFDVSSVSRESRFTLVPLQFQADERRREYLELAFAVRHPNGSAHALMEDVLYVLEEKMGDGYDLCALGVDAGGRGFFGCVEDLRTGGDEDGRLIIPVERLEEED
jgi:hypothetical protein